MNKILNELEVMLDYDKSSNKQDSIASNEAIINLLIDFNDKNKHTDISK